MKLLATTALAALVATGAAAQTPAPPHARGLSPDTPLVNITTEGRSDRTPDLVMFNAGVVAQGATAAAAMSANTAQMNAVVAALRSAGVAERDIQTSTLSLQPTYHYPPPPRDGAAEPAVPRPPTIIGYEARNTVSVKLRRVGEMGRLMDALVSAGANQVDGPYFSVEQPDAAADEARADALRKARARAELYARESGFRTARLLTISEGGGYYPLQRDLQSIVVTGGRVGAQMAPPPPPPPVQSGEVAVGVTLSVQFALER
ncbi:SIMPL domain-containing protein [Phenylobacterium sp.]|uniref:SIMPL domain-containing protein n=1 Tax=Phenylobacterium sp. TaxID=1871053 RepID=UPI002FDA5CFE